jgi:hypothetical protein
MKLALIANDEVTAYEEVVANEADVGVNVIDVAADAVVANEALVGINVIEFAALAVVAKEADVGVNVMEVAADAVVANDELPNNDPVIPPETPRLPDTTNDPDVANDPVNVTVSDASNSDPVIVCVPLNVLDPVVAKTAEDVLFNSRAFCANEDVVANDADAGVNVMEFAADAVVANDDVVLNDALLGVNVIDVAALAVVANEELPSKDPVIPPVTPKLPDIANDPDVVNDPLKTTMSVVSSNDPVIVWVPLKELDPVVANTADDVLFNTCAFCANDDVVANDAVPGVNVILVAALDVVAKDADDGVKVIEVAADAVVANEADVPVSALNCVELDRIPVGNTKLPLIVPRTLSDPVN